MIKALLIDIDDTLLDFAKCAENAMKLAFEEEGLPFSDDVQEKFHFVNNRLWREIENGTLTREGLSLIRWNKIFSLLGIEHDGVQTENAFKKYLAESAEKIDGASEMLEYLKGKYLLAAASNGPWREQVSRMKKAEIFDYFDYIFISEKVGYSKPDIRFFDECKKAFDLPGNEIMMIGDSVNADIDGARKAGIITCFFDFHASGTECQANMRIQKLSDLKEIL